MYRLVALSLLAACGGPTVLAAHVQLGPAVDVQPTRILMLDATCGSARSECPDRYIEVVDQIVRSSFELSGYAIVSGEQLRGVTRDRSELHEAATTRLSTGERLVRSESSARSTIVLAGPDFEDLSVPERQRVIAQAGADAVASVRIVITGGEVDWDRRHHVEVMVRLGLDHGDTLAWASRCRVRARDASSVTSALEHAARCAVHGGTGR